MVELGDTCLLTSAEVTKATTLWTVIFIVYANILAKHLRSQFSTCRFWNEAGTRECEIYGTDQGKILHMFVMSVHHWIAGLVMVIADATGNQRTWQVGFLMEVAVEVARIIEVVFPVRLWKKRGRFYMRPFGVLRRVPLLVASTLLLQSKHQANAYIHDIGIWLLLAASVSYYAEFYVLTLDIEAHMLTAIFAQVANTILCAYARVYKFPKESAKFLRQNWNDTNSSIAEAASLYVGESAMLLVNVFVVSELVGKTIQFVKRTRYGFNAPSSEPQKNNRLVV